MKIIEIRNCEMFPIDVWNCGVEPNQFRRENRLIDSCIGWFLNMMGDNSL